MIPFPPSIYLAVSKSAGYTAPEGAWLKPSSEITWVDRDIECLTANKDAILEYWNSLLADVQG